MITKTQRELNLEYWGRVHDMCDAYNKQHRTADIRPYQCVRHCGNMWNLKEHPYFDGSKYDLAVAIIENQPVFAGDKIYYKLDGALITVGDGAVIVGDNWMLTPPKPKRTFELNGQKLPCPSNNEFCDTALLDLFGEYYYFESIEDRNKVAKAILDILKNARSKE